MYQLFVLTLPQFDVSDGGINVISDGLTGVDHESVGEFHGLGTLSSQFSWNKNV